MRQIFPNAQIDVIPNLIVPANSFMLASALKSPILFLCSLGLAVLLNATSLFQGDEFWTKAPRSVMALVSVPLCGFLFFHVDDPASQTIEILFGNVFVQYHNHCCRVLALS